MQFTIQYMGPVHAPAADHDWAVVIGNEHIIFTGSYRDCEDWLDHHENCANRSRPTCQRVSTIRRGCIRSMLSSFLGDDAGQSSPAHAVLLAAGLGILFILASTTSENIASALVSLHHISVARALAGYDSCEISGCQHSACDADRLDIACALAPAGDEADKP